MNKEEVIIYHNKEDEKIYVKVPEGHETYFQLQNLAGKIISDDTHRKAVHDFDLTGLPEGNYFVLVSQYDLIRSKKIMIGLHEL